MRRLALLLLCLAACRYDLGLDSTGGDDAGADSGASVDSGASTDSGMSPDAGTPFDAGRPPYDGGVFTPVSNVGCVQGLLGDGGTLVAGGGEVFAAGSYEYSPCTSNSQCGCPLSCQPDPVIAGGPGVLFCLYPCRTSADCPNPTTFCQAGVCTARQCASDGGTLWGSCDGDDWGDGVCQLTFPILNNNSEIGICELSGSAPVGAACNPMGPECGLDGNCQSLPPVRQDGSGALCAPGLACILNSFIGSLTFSDAGIPVSNPPDTCQEVCDPTAQPDPCAAHGQTCVATPGRAYPHNGVCTSVGSDGCLTATHDWVTLFGACTTSAQCACDQICATDFQALPNSGGLPPPDGGQKVCAPPCQTTADCWDPTTQCQNGACLPNVPAACGHGTLAAVCNAAGTSDGTCLGSVASGSTECVQAGTAALNQPCELNLPSRAVPAQLCQRGLTCAGLLDGGSVCRQVCTPSVPATQAECPAGDLCEPLFIDAWSANSAVSALALGACYTEASQGCATAYGLGYLGAGCTNDHDCACPFKCDAGVDAIGDPVTFCQ